MREKAREGVSKEDLSAVKEEVIELVRKRERKLDAHPNLISGCSLYAVSSVREKGEG